MPCAQMTQVALVCRGLQHISELTNLEDVNLSDTAITDQGMLAFAPLKAMQRLNLSYTGAPLTFHSTPAQKVFWH